MDTLEQQYLELKNRLNKDTAVHSNPIVWLEHEAYKSIVAIGKDIVPFIIADLERNLKTDRCEDYPGWWAMYALSEITGVQIKLGGPEAKRIGGFAAVSVDDVSRFWVNWFNKNNE